MKTLLRTATLTALVATSLALPLRAEDQPAGFVDFGKFAPPAGGGQFVEVNVQSQLINLAARLTEKKEPEVASLLRGLKSVRVNVVGLDDANRAANIEKIEAARTKLESQGWSKLVTVREANDGDNVAIFAKMKGDDSIEGLVVTVIDRKGEAVFVNIVGTINPDKIAALADKYDLEPLRHVKIKAKAKVEKS